MENATPLEEYRPALTGHCYRMFGLVIDAEDAVQESMLRAWKGIDNYRAQASLKPGCTQSPPTCVSIRSPPRSGRRERVRSTTRRLPVSCVMISCSKRVRASTGLSRFPTLTRCLPPFDTRNPAVVPRALSTEQADVVARYVDLAHDLRHLVQRLPARAGQGVRWDASMGPVQRQRQDRVGAAATRKERGRAPSPKPDCQIESAIARSAWARAFSPSSKRSLNARPIMPVVRSLWLT